MTDKTAEEMEKTRNKNRLREEYLSFLISIGGVRKGMRYHLWLEEKIKAEREADAKQWESFEEIIKTFDKDNWIKKADVIFLIKKVREAKQNDETDKT